MTDTNWAPARIWLQRGVGEEGSHTWCEDSIDECEQAEYVRVDVAAGPTDEPEYPPTCDVCNGAKGGVPGNENIIDGKRVCDYCHADGSHTALPPASTNSLTDDEILQLAANTLGNPLLLEDLKQGFTVHTEADDWVRFAQAIIAETEGK